MTTVILVRHGESIGNTENRLMWCRIGSTLSEKWTQQANSTAKFLKTAYKDVVRIYTSPVNRAQETAKIIAQEYNLSLITREDIREMDFGEMTWKTLSEIPKAINDAYFLNTYEHSHAWGESLRDLQSRVVNFMDEAIYNAKDDEIIMVVTHENVIRGIIGNLKWLTKEITYLKIEYASVIVYEIDKDRVTCIDFNKKIS